MAAICMQCLTELFYLQGTRSCCIFEAGCDILRFHVNPDPAFLGRSLERSIFLIMVNVIIHTHLDTGVISQP